MTTYVQMRGTSLSVYDMQPYLLKIRGFWLRKAFAAITCGGHQLLVHPGRYHVPQLQRKDSTCRILQVKLRYGG